MSRYITYLLVLLMCIQASAQMKPNYTQEPPVQYEVLINGKVYPFAEGIPNRIPGTYNNPEIRIHTVPYRHFENELLVFDYPIYFNFEFEKEGSAYSNWTFNGKSVTVMQFLMGADVPLKDFVSKMLNKFGEANCTVNYDKEVIGKIELETANLMVRIVGQPLNIKFYARSTQRQTYFLAIQDALNDDESTTTEYNQFLILLKRTLQWKK